MKTGCAVTGDRFERRTIIGIADRSACLEGCAIRREEQIRIDRRLPQPVDVIGPPGLIDNEPLLAHGRGDAGSINSKTNGREEHSRTGEPAKSTLEILPT